MGLDQTIEDAFVPADLVYDPTVMCAVRNAGKWRRETVYEKQMSAKSLYTTINFPILRYADVLLMYAEAINEYAGAPGRPGQGGHPGNPQTRGRQDRREPAGRLPFVP